jgi:acyl-coenzyme A thioesterase PaaI-like protein
VPCESAGPPSDDDGADDTDTANFAGNVRGGTILKLLDQVAYACASRYTGRYVVTLSVDQVVFRQAIHVGELVSFLASINHTGSTSMEMGIKVIAENIRTQAVRHVNSCTAPPIYARRAPPPRRRRAAQGNAAGDRAAAGRGAGWH